MFRVSLANAFAKRTLRPLHEKHQATPVQVNLDAGVGATDIYSGMVAELTSSGTVTIADASSTAANIFGLFALDKNSVINDLDGQPADLLPFAVWQGGPDAYFKIEVPALDDAQTYVVGDELVVASDGKVTKSGVGGAGTVKIGVVTREITDNDVLEIRVLLPAAQ